MPKRLPVNCPTPMAPPSAPRNSATSSLTSTRQYPVLATDTAPALTMKPRDTMHAGDVAIRRRFFVGSKLLAQLQVALLLIAQAGTLHAARPPAIAPDNAQVVLERLPRGYAALMPS